MPELVYSIKTRAELAGAESALRALEAQIGKAKALQKDYTALEAQATKARAAIAQAQASGVGAEAAQSVESLAQAQGKAASAAADHAKQAKTLHSVVFGLNQLIPSLGSLVGYAVSPIAVALGFAVVAWRTFTSRVQEANAEIRRLNEEAARPLTNRLEAQRQTIVGTAEALGDFHTKLDAAARGEQSLSEKAAQNIAHVQDQQQAAGGLAEALYQREQAGLDWLHQQGIVSEQQYIDQKLSLQIGYQRKKREIEEQAALAELMIRRRMLEDAKDEQSAKDTAAKESIDAEQKALEDLASTTTPEESRQRRDEARKRLREFELGVNPKTGDEHPIQTAVLEQFAEMGPGLTEGQRAAWLNQRAAEGKDFYLGYDKLYEKWSQLKLAESGAQRAYDQAPEAYAKKRAAANRASARTDLLQRRSIEGQDFITEQERTLGLDRARFDLQHETGQKIQQLNTETAILQTYGDQLQPGQANISAAAMRMQATTGRQEAALLNVLGVVEQTQMRQIQILNRWGRMFAASLNQLGGWARAGRLR